jgi:hypothetical protein
MNSAALSSINRKQSNSNLGKLSLDDIFKQSQTLSTLKVERR